MSKVKGAVEINKLYDELKTEALRRQYVLTSLDTIKAEESYLYVEGSKAYLLDEVAVRKLAKYLAIPDNYIIKLPMELKETLLNYHFCQFRGSEVKLVVVDKNLIDVRAPESNVLEHYRTVQSVMNVVGEDAEVVNVKVSGASLQIDTVVINKNIEVKKPGDISYGGIRFFMNEDLDWAPSAYSFIHTMICSNGLCVDEPFGKISLRGNTVPEILKEMERVAEEVLGLVDGRLDAYKLLNDQMVKNPEQAILQYGKQAGLSKSIINLAVSRVPELPEPVSMYDIVNLFTYIASHEAGIHDSQVWKLQHLGGMLLTEGEGHRCQTCNLLLEI